ncbi:MAG: restriction endonuclease [Bdellovibrionaceae bacterium]|nr:restriction endonuclease [Pseudobdellovibrionaceae bacterium]
MSLPKDFPSFDMLMAPTVIAIRELGGSGNIGEIFSKLIENCKFPEEFLNITQPNQSGTVLEYRASWARTYLKACGVIINSQKGVWTLTEFGKSFDLKDLPKLMFEARRGFTEKTKEKHKNSKKNADGILNAEEENLFWKDDLIEVLTKIVSPDGFERLCQLLLREAGFKEVKVTGKTGDGGIDGVGILRNGLISEIVLFQCKRFRGSVSPSMVRDFRGAMQGRSSKGIIITTGTFTTSAKDEATRDGAHPIELIDGAQLCDLLKQFKLGVETQMVEEVTVSADWLKAV